MLNSLSTEEVAAPLASLARTLALPQTSVSRQCLSLMARQPGSQEPSLPLRCRLSCLHPGTQGRYPRRPSPGPNPDRGTRFPAALGSAPGPAGGHAAPRSRRLPLGSCLLTSRDSPAPGPASPEAPPPGPPLPVARPRRPASPAESAGGAATILTRNQLPGATARGGPPRLRCTGRDLLLSSVRESFAWLCVCRSTLCPR